MSKGLNPAAFLAAATSQDFNWQSGIHNQYSNQPRTEFAADPQDKAALLRLQGNTNKHENNNERQFDEKVLALGQSLERIKSQYGNTNQAQVVSDAEE